MVCDIPVAAQNIKSSQCRIWQWVATICRKRFKWKEKSLKIKPTRNMITLGAKSCIKVARTGKKESKRWEIIISVLVRLSRPIYRNCIKGINREVRLLQLRRKYAINFLNYRKTWVSKYKRLIVTWCVKKNHLKLRFAVSQPWKLKRLGFQNMFCIVESPARVEKISILRLFDLFVFYWLLISAIQYRKNSIIA